MMPVQLREVNGSLSKLKIDTAILLIERRNIVKLYEVGGVANSAS